MKLLIFPILFNLLFVDSKTNEKLSGVMVETSNKVYYSNFDGEVSVPKNETIKKISYISYQTISEVHITSDSLIKLSELR